MAARIKDMGYLYDCGYNQLLYPVEAQTRNLLKWLVERLPRSEEEGAQEVLGASALMNRRIVHALEAWKAQPRQLPGGWNSSSGGAARSSAYHNRNFCTVPLLLADQQLLSHTLPLFRAVHSQQQQQYQQPSIEHSIFERHALELVSDSRYALRLERDFVDPEAAAAAAAAAEAEGGDALAAAMAADASASDAAAAAGAAQGALAAAIKNSLLAAMRRRGSTAAAAAAGAGGGGKGGSGGDESAEGGSSGYSRVAFAEEHYNAAQQEKLLSASFQELIQSIADDPQRKLLSGYESEALADLSANHRVGFRS